MARSHEVSTSVTALRLRAILRYQPETGRFVRLISGRGFRAGVDAGCLHVASGYVYIGIDRRNYRAHRLAWLYMTGEWPEEIDHMNGDRSDNKWGNLRLATRSLNNANGKRRSDNTSGYKGVNWVERAKLWRAYINSEGKQSHLGYFKSLDDAIAARLVAARLTFGEFSRI